MYLSRGWWLFFGATMQDADELQQRQNQQRRRIEQN